MIFPIHDLVYCLARLFLLSRQREKKKKKENDDEQRQIYFVIWWKEKDAHIFFMIRQATHVSWTSHTAFQANTRTIDRKREFFVFWLSSDGCLLLCWIIMMIVITTGHSIQIDRRRRRLFFFAWHWIFFLRKLIDMRRRVRAVPAEIHLNIDSDDNVSPISPIFTHHMINLSPLFPNYFVGVWALLFFIFLFFCKYNFLFCIPSIYHQHLLQQLID